MAWCVYILHCADGTLYTGCTNDLTRRLNTHQAGKGAKYTRSRLPVELAYSEPAADRSQALRREAAIKRLPRQEKLVLIEKRLKEGASSAPTVSRAVINGGTVTPQGRDR